MTTLFWPTQPAGPGRPFRGTRVKGKWLNLGKGGHPRVPAPINMINGACAETGACGRRLRGWVPASALRTNILSASAAALLGGADGFAGQALSAVGPGALARSLLLGRACLTPKVARAGAFIMLCICAPLLHLRYLLGAPRARPFGLRIFFMTSSPELGHTYTLCAIERNAGWFFSPLSAFWAETSCLGPGSLQRALKKIEVGNGRRPPAACVWFGCACSGAHAFLRAWEHVCI